MPLIGVQFYLIIVDHRRLIFQQMGICPAKNGVSDLVASLLGSCVFCSLIACPLSDRRERFNATNAPASLPRDPHAR